MEDCMEDRREDCMEARACCRSPAREARVQGTPSCTGGPSPLTPCAGSVLFHKNVSGKKQLEVTLPDRPAQQRRVGGWGELLDTAAQAWRLEIINPSCPERADKSPPAGASPIRVR